MPSSALPLPHTGKDVLASSVLQEDGLEVLLDEALDEFSATVPKPTKYANRKVAPKSDHVDEEMSFLSEKEPANSQDFIKLAKLMESMDFSSTNQHDPSDHETFSVFQNLWQSFSSQDMHSKADALEDALNENAPPFNDEAIHQLIDQILSKDILYDPMKDLDTKYQAYKEQSIALHELILLWESEEDRKKKGVTLAKEEQEAFKKYSLELLQKVEQFGPPPKELLPKTVENGEKGTKMSPEECSMM